MIVLDKLRKVAASGARFLGLRRHEQAPVRDLPDGISFQVLADLCLERRGEALRHVSYLHLSTWKLSGTYRLFLRTKRGRRWKLIYKNAVYSPRHFPGLVGFPARLGPPEYLVYSSAQGALARYLPVIYRCLELVPGGHYQYLLEDISEEYDPASEPEAILRGAAELPVLHRALGEWAVSIDQNRLVRYDSAFLAAFQDYASKNLERYAQETGDETVAEVCAIWPQISRLYGAKEFQEVGSARPIHGDFAPSNILIHRKHPGQIKLVDWEWAGLGVPHLDLAELLKRAKPEAEEQALQLFAKQHNHLSLHQHRRLYEWCKLVLGVRDAAYGAAQQMGSAGATGIDLHRGIVAGARLALRAYGALTRGEGATFHLDPGEPNANPVRSLR